MPELPGDEHHPSPPKLLDHAEAVIEHHREADDHGDPNDAAVGAFVQFCRDHRGVIFGGAIDLNNGDELIFDSVDESVLVASPLRGERLIRLDLPADQPPGDR